MIERLEIKELLSRARKKIVCLKVAEKGIWVRSGSRKKKAAFLGNDKGFGNWPGKSGIWCAGKRVGLFFVVKNNIEIRDFG